MSTVIRTLATELKLQAENFNNGLKNAARESKEFEKALKPSLTLAKDLGAGMVVAGGAIAGGMLVAAKSAIDYADNLNDLRQKSGASVETLAKLGFAAEQSGSSMDGLATGLKFLAKNMEAAGSGGKQQLASFAALGVSAKDLAAAHGDVNQIMLLVADRFKAMDDGAEKTALAMQIFGKSGADLIPMLNEGSAGLKKLGDDAAKAGLVMSQETAEASDKLNDTLNEMKASALGASLGIATALLPALQSSASLATEATQHLGSLIKEHQTLTQAAFGTGAALLGVGTALVSIAVLTPKIKEGFELTALALSKVGITLTAAAVGYAALGAAIGVGIGLLINWAIEGTRVQKWLDGFVDGTLKKLGFEWGATSEAQQSAAFTAAAVAKAHADGLPFFKAVTAAIPPHIKLTAEQTAELKKQNDELEKTRKFWADEKIAMDEAKDATLRHQGVLIAFTANMNTAAAATKFLADARRGLIAAGADAAVDTNALNLEIQKVLASTNILTDAQRAAIGIVQKKNEVDQDAIDLHKKLTAEEIALTRAAEQSAAAMRQAIDDVQRSAGKIFDDMFIKGENVFKSLRNLLKGGALSLGRTIFQDVVGTALGPLKKAFDDFFIGLLKSAGLQKFLGGLTDKVTGALSGSAMNAAGGAASSAGGVASSAGGAASGAGGAAGGMAGNITAAAGVVTAVSSVVQNVQLAKLEGTMNAVEANTRFTYIELKDLMDLQMNPVIWYLEHINLALGGGAKQALAASIPQTGLATSASQVFANAVRDFVEAVKKVVPGSGAVPAAVSISMPIEITNTFDLNGTEITALTVRDTIIPEITTVLDTGIRGVREKWTAIIKSGLDGIVSSQVPA